MKSHRSNEELLQLFKNDDPIAFYTLYERFSGRLYAFVYGFLKQESDAEDIVQEAFIKIWESRNKINLYSSFESFLFTIAYNATISLFRKRVNEKEYLQHLKTKQQLADAPAIIEEIQFLELDAKVKSLIAELSPRQKEVFQLSREEGLSHQEIAERLGISVGTVKKHMVNSLAFLKSHLDSTLLINFLFFSLFF